MAKLSSYDVILADIRLPDVTGYEIYQKLRDASRVEVEIERRGETLRNSYSIE